MIQRMRIEIVRLSGLDPTLYCDRSACLATATCRVYAFGMDDDPIPACDEHADDIADELRLRYG
jgi:hypothetical protein